MTKQGKWTASICVYVALSYVLLLSAACGGRGESGGTAVEAVVPTMPPAQFTAVSSQGTFTETVAITETAATSGVANPDLERGARSYAKNNCAQCHGEQGEGVSGKGEAIAGTTLALNEFDTLLRTGGGLGTEHIFGPSAVSPTGMEFLYEYVKSLTK